MNGGGAGDDRPPLAIAMFSPGWPPSHAANGVVTYTGAIIGGLRSLGHRVHVLTPRLHPAVDGSEGVTAVDLATEVSGPSEWALRRIDVLRARARPLVRDRWVARSLRSATRRLAARGAIQLLEMEESFGWVRAASRIPTVVRLHGPWFINGPNEGADPGHPDYARRVADEGRAIRAAAAVSSPSRHVLERVREFYGIPLDGAEVIPNPVQAVAPGDRWRPEESEPGHVLFVGRFDRTKGGDVVIGAFARLLRDRPEARLTFVGPDVGVAEGGRRWSLAEYVDRLIPGALADGRVRALGRRPQPEVGALRRRAAATVIASRNENFPMTLIEAMAAGCPLVSTRVGGAAEALEDGTHGLFCAPESPEGLAARLADLLSDPAGAAAMGRRAAAHCAAHYDPEVVAARTAALYRRALAVADPGRGRS